MRNKEGIDRIGVLLNPLFLKKENISKYKDPRRRLTLHVNWNCCVLSIHEEWFDPFKDYQMQIAMAVYELVKEGIIEFPDNMFTLYFIYRFYEYFILSIVGVEFFSDFKDENIKMNTNKLKTNISDAKIEGGLFQYNDKEKNLLTDTYYSPDYKGSRKSQFITYDRLGKLIKDNNHASVEVLKKNQNPWRCEFKVFSNNSQWLNWDNLKGNYQQILNRHKEYLAVIYNNQVDGCLTVKGNENPNFRNVVKTAKENNMIRFSNANEQLKKKEKISELSSDNGLEIFDDFSKKVSIIRATGIFNKKVSKINEERPNMHKYN
jgi:hypothetical protein